METPEELPWVEIEELEEMVRVRADQAEKEEKRSVRRPEVGQTWKRESESERRGGKSKLTRRRVGSREGGAVAESRVGVHC